MIQRRFVVLNLYMKLIYYSKILPASKKIRLLALPYLISWSLLLSLVCILDSPFSCFLDGSFGVFLPEISNFLV